MKRAFAFLFLVTATASFAATEFETAREAILKMTGCYLVDYSYSETEGLKEGYTVDLRVYDANKDKTVRELIYPVEVSDRKIRLQHVLFFSDLDGKLVEESLMKHTGEDWEFEPEHWYDFVGPRHWKPRKPEGEGKWVRRVTNLDDGLRHQCVGGWKLGGGYREWACSSYAPIPGREYRDMGRKDYNTMERGTRLIVYGQSFLERQENVKTIHEGEKRTPLAREVGKNWYVRAPMSECRAAVEWVKPRRAFWDLVRETWDEVLDGGSDFIETAPPGKPPRFVRIGQIEQKYFEKLPGSAEAAKQAKREILDVIAEYRAR